ncbi:MAG TPA: DUF4395 domain-containing protein [Ktedonobacterales bacterium]
MAAEAFSPSAGAPRVDTHLLKFSQAWVVGLTLIAFALQSRWLVLVAALALLISAAAPAVGPFRLLYRYVALPARLLRPRIVEDDPAPHRFAQGVGAAFLVASTLVLFLAPGAASVGWALDLIVFALALINLTVGFCAGCFVYYHLGRFGLAPRVRYAGGFHWRGA